MHIYVILRNHPTLSLQKYNDNVLKHHSQASSYIGMHAQCKALSGLDIYTGSAATCKVMKVVYIRTYSKLSWLVLHTAKWCYIGDLHVHPALLLLSLYTYSELDLPPFQRAKRISVFNLMSSYDHVQSSKFHRISQCDTIHSVRSLSNTPTIQYTHLQIAQV